MLILFEFVDDCISEVFILIFDPLEIPRANSETLDPSLTVGVNVISLSATSALKVIEYHNIIVLDEEVGVI